MPNGTNDDQGCLKVSGRLYDRRSCEALFDLAGYGHAFIGDAGKKFGEPGAFTRFEVDETRRRASERAHPSHAREIPGVHHMAADVQALCEVNADAQGPSAVF